MEVQLEEGLLLADDQIVLAEYRYDIIYMMEKLIEEYSELGLEFI